MAEYLERLFGALGHVPPILREKLWRLRQLDETAVDMEAQLERRQTELLQAAREAVERFQGAGEGEDPVDAEELQGIRDGRQQLRELYDQKSALARDIYDILDSCCKQMDKDIRVLQGLLPEFAQAAISGRKKKGRAQEDPPHAQALLHGAHGEQAPGAGAGPGAQASDPNEPLYCICKNVSFGEMVGCDNDDCPIEWFHLACVGLEAPPADDEKWFCPLCAKPDGAGAGAEAPAAAGIAVDAR